MSNSGEAVSAEQRAAGSAASERAHLQRIGRPAVDALRRTVSLVLTEVFGGFVRQLPRALDQRAQTSPFIPEQRICNALARAIEADPDRWVADFVSRVDTGLIGTADAVAKKAAADAAVNDDTLALSQTELRAEALYADLVATLDVRLDNIRRTVYFPLYTGALAPAGLCRALQETAGAMQCRNAELRLLFERFDELFFPQLPRLYRILIESLADIERRAAEAAALREREIARAEALRARPPAAPVAEPPPTAAPAKAEPTPAPAIDSKTESMLRAAAAKPADEDEGYSDSALASDLLRLQSNEALSGGDLKPERRWVPLQRISLAGQFLNEAIADPLVPREMEPQHESVRFPLVKSALTDATLFTALTHPLRSLVNELMLKSATSRITGTAEARRMAEVLQQVLVQFDLAPDFVREAMLTAQPIREEQIKAFFTWQKEQARQRREAVIEEAKRLVVRELELRTFGRWVPAPAIKFLNTCWGPLLVKRLLQHGADNAHWRAGIDLMESMLDHLELSDNQMPPPEEWQQRAKTMAKALHDGGLPPERIKEAMGMLTAAWRAPKQELPF
ncbi:MAG: DUF1631 family protein [Pseudomonadota bacterium]